MKKVNRTTQYIVVALIILSTILSACMNKQDVAEAVQQGIVNGVATQNANTVSQVATQNAATAQPAATQNAAGQQLAATAQGALPATTPIAAPAQSTTCPAGTVDWNWYKTQTAGITDPGDLITFNDAQPQKIDHKAGGWTVTGTSIVTTGWYNPNKTGATARLVNGETGTWLVTDANVPTPGGELRLCNYDGDAATIGPVYNSPSGKMSTGTCAAKTDLINTYKGMVAINADQVFVNFDVMVDNQPLPRLRSDTGTTVDGLTGQILLWTQIGTLSGGPFDTILESNGKGLYLLESQSLYTTTRGASGVKSCDVLTAADFK